MLDLLHLLAFLIDPLDLLIRAIAALCGGDEQPGG
jgi:hypothetical protein